MQNLAEMAGMKSVKQEKTELVTSIMQEASKLDMNDPKSSLIIAQRFNQAGLTGLAQKFSDQARVRTVKNKELSLQEIRKMNVIQLNMWDNTPIITPKGKKTTAKEWARSLNILYAPSIIFFDSEGAEIIRVDSVTYFYRLWGVLDYVNQEGYKQTTDYQNWRLQQRKIKQ